MLFFLLHVKINIKVANSTSTRIAVPLKPVKALKKHATRPKIVAFAIVSTVK